MKLAGLDIGTTGCKCAVFDENGAYLGKAYRDYPVKRSTSGHEIDVSNVMGAVYEVIREMTAQYSDIAGIGVTSFGETFVMTDEAGTPLHVSMLYTDPRGAEECKELTEKIGGRNIARMTGLRPHEMYGLPKMMWIKRHQPEIYAKARHIFQMEDYVVFHLTGQAKIDYSLATRTMAFDISKLEWCSEMFAAADVDATLLSAPVPSGTVAGCVTPEAAKETGLSTDAKVICVGQDQVGAAIGAGAFSADVAVDGAGTVQCLTPVFEGLPDPDVMYNGYFSVVPYVVPGTYVAYAFSYTGGALTQWCTNTLAKEEKAQAKEKGISVNQFLEEQYAARRGEEPSGLLVLPHFAGAATPYMDTGAKGVVAGMTTDTDVADIYRGCLEGVAYEMVLNAKALDGSGVRFQGLNATGGGARSAVWMQMKADMLNVPVTALVTEDAGTVGSAMLVGIACGVFADLADAAAHMVETKRVYEPRPEMHEKYMKIYERYAPLYAAVRPLL